MSRADNGGASLERLDDLKKAVGSVILGKDDIIEMALIALLARGNLLIEDIPGVGKTTLAQALARSIDCSFKRIQFTSDLLPTDILGVKIFDPKTGEFKFMPGPVFNSIVLADEINRTTPRSQSALLEAMGESQVTIEGETYPLPRPFMVIATENPIEHHGTYPLPDSQLDRFTLSVSVGYPGREFEREMLLRDNGGGGAEAEAVMDAEEVVLWQDRADKVRLDPAIADYILDLVEATRKHERVRLGASPRGSLALRQSARARALLSGRDFCLPDDVKAAAVAALAHRLMINGVSGPAEQRRAARETVAEILDTVPAPV